MKVNITAGMILNGMLENAYAGEQFIPFNEAMIIGTYTSKLFSVGFIEERAKTHNVSLAEYTEKLGAFLEFLDCIENYNEVVLWFGDEPFCEANVKTVLQTLKEYNFQGKILLHTVVEETGEIVKSTLIQDRERIPSHKDYRTVLLQVF